MKTSNPQPTTVEMSSNISSLGNVDGQFKEEKQHIEQLIKRKFPNSFQN